MRKWTAWCGGGVSLLLVCLAVPAFGATATLTWTDNSTNEMGFEVQRKAELCAGVAGTWGPLGAVSANVATYADATVAEGAPYCYRVRAWNTVDGTPTGTKQYSAWSNTAGATIPFSVPAAPGSLGITVAP